MLNRLSSRRLTVVIGLAFVVFAIFVPVTAFMIGNNQPEPGPDQVNAPTPPPEKPDANFAPPGSQAADVVRMIGPISQDKNLRDLPPRAATQRKGEMPELFRHPKKEGKLPREPETQAVFPTIPQSMPAPLATFAGINSTQSGCLCAPPDTDGDVGRNNYIQSVNARIKIIDKSGVEQLAPTTYNTFFSALGTSTPCGNSNDGDGVVLYDHIVDRWLVSDFAFTSFPGSSFYQCIGVSKTGDPVAGGWWLYAIQIDPANPTFLGDYPKFGIWPDGYYMSVNLFTNNTTFNGVRVFAFDRNAMINGNPTNTIAFTVSPATLGDTYSLVPATFRTRSSPAAGTPEYFMAIGSPATGGVALNTIYTWRFHVDFVTPGNSTFGIGANHAPNGTTTVANFVDAFTDAAGFSIIPQQGTANRIDTLGDKLMYPLVYQNLFGTESIYAAHTVLENFPNGPSSIRWYQFDVTGGTIPSGPAQQQTFNNGGDGLWRFMPSLNVDLQGNVAIGYSVSGSAMFPSIRYAGRLATDSLSTLAQGEAEMQAGSGSQTTSHRWGDYSAMFVDPNDWCTFWHTNQYLAANGSAWQTSIGNFKFAGCLIPTAGGVSISGQVMSASRHGIAKATVTLTDMEGHSRTVRATSFGNYSFDDVTVGKTYVITASAKKYLFAARTVSLVDEVTDLDFVAQP